jgi:hypothetical protein
LAHLIKRIALRVPEYLSAALVKPAAAWTSRQSEPKRLGHGAVGMTSSAPAKPEKSYLSAAVESISPWTSRSSTPTPASQGTTEGGAKAQQGLDHSVTLHHGIPFRRYPKDCPPLETRWFYAVDVSLVLWSERTTGANSVYRRRSGNRSSSKRPPKIKSHFLLRRSSPHSRLMIPHQWRQHTRHSWNRTSKPRIPEVQGGQT